MGCSESRIMVIITVIFFPVMPVIVALVIVYTIAEGIVLGVVKHRYAILNGLGNIALVAINLPINATYCAVKTASIAWGKLKQIRSYMRTRALGKFCPGLVELQD